jgi:hypothetical protein
VSPIAPSVRPWPVPRFLVVGAGLEGETGDVVVEIVELGALPVYPLRMPFE